MDSGPGFKAILGVEVSGRAEGSRSRPTAKSRRLSKKVE